MAATTITFDGYDMQSATVLTSDIDDGQPFDRQVVMQQVLGAAGAAVTDDQRGIKSIPVKGILLGAASSDVDALVDAFNAAMDKTGKNLDIGNTGGTRRWVCTPTMYKTYRPVRASNFANFEVLFAATEYGKDTSTTTLVNATTATTASQSIGLTIGGSASNQKLRIAITVTAATGLANKTVGVANSTTGLRAYIQRTWTVGDVVEFDCLNETVKVNSVLLDFNGNFPVFAPGSQTLVIDNDFTTCTLTRTVDYTRRWQ